MKQKKCLNLTVSDAFPFIPRVGCQAEFSHSLGRRASRGRRKGKRCISKRFRKRRRKGGRRREINFVSLAKLLAEEEEEEEKGGKGRRRERDEEGKKFPVRRTKKSLLLLLSPHTLQKLEEGEGGRGNLPGQPTIQPGIFLPSLPLGFSDIHRGGSPSNPKKK